MNAAKVRPQVYEQDMDSDEETSELLHPPPASCGWRNLPPVHHMKPSHYATNDLPALTAQGLTNCCQTVAPSKRVALQHVQKQ